MFLSLFNSFAFFFALHPPDIVCLQDPPFWRSRLPAFTGFKSFSPPHSPGSRPKVAFYVSSAFLSYATVLPRFFDRSDVAALDLFGVNLFGESFTRFQISNLYNLWSQRSSARTVSPNLSFPDDGFPLLVVGDFNIHHPLADPLRAYSRRDLAASFPYFSRATNLGFELLNLPGVFTRFPWDSATRHSVIDLSFASPLLFPFFRSWDTSLPSTGSDHVPISLTFAHPISSPPSPVPNWSLTDWDSLSPALNELLIPPHTRLPPAFPSRATSDLLRLRKKPTRSPSSPQLPPG